MFSGAFQCLYIHLCDCGSLEEDMQREYMNVGVEKSKLEADLNWNRKRNTDFNGKIKIRASRENIFIIKKGN